MITVLNTAYETEGALQADIQQAQEKIENWRKTEGVPAPIFSNLIQEILNGEVYEFIDKTPEKYQQDIVEAQVLAGKEEFEAEQAAIDLKRKVAQEAFEAEKLAAQTTPSPKYALFRQMEYPDPMTYNDARVKQHSEDPDMQAEGLAQEQQYYVDCLAVKAKYPKYIA